MLPLGIFLHSHKTGQPVLNSKSLTHFWNGSSMFNLESGQTWVSQCPLTGFKMVEVENMVIRDTLNADWLEAIKGMMYWMLIIIYSLHAFSSPCTLLCLFLYVQSSYCVPLTVLLRQHSHDSAPPTAPRCFHDGVSGDGNICNGVLLMAMVMQSLEWLLFCLQWVSNRKSWGHRQGF